VLIEQLRSVELPPEQRRENPHHAAHLAQRCADSLLAEPWLAS
jgi:hypothetical protein